MAPRANQKPAQRLSLTVLAFATPLAMSLCVSFQTFASVKAEFNLAPSKTVSLLDEQPETRQFVSALGANQTRAKLSSLPLPALMETLQWSTMDIDSGLGYTQLLKTRIVTPLEQSTYANASTAMAKVLTESERNVVKHYTASHRGSYLLLNRILKKHYAQGGPLSTQSIDPAMYTNADAEELVQLDDTIQKSSITLPKGTVLFRGIRDASDIPGINDEFRLPGFTSVTLNPATALEFTGTIREKRRPAFLIIEVGDPSLKAAIPSNAAEMELIVPRGFHLKVLSKELQNGVEVIRLRSK